MQNIMQSNFDFWTHLFCLQLKDFCKYVIAKLSCISHVIFLGAISSSTMMKWPQYIDGVGLNSIKPVWALISQADCSCVGAFPGAATVGTSTTDLTLDGTGSLLYSCCNLFVMSSVLLVIVDP